MATDLKSWAARQGAPLTMGLAASFVVMAVLSLVTKGATYGTLVLQEKQPWTALTYPWALDSLVSPMGLLLLVLLTIWMVQFGGSVERDMGTTRFGTFWVVATVLFGLVGLGFEFPLAGPMLPGAAVIVVWGARNQRSSVLLYGILPISGLWLALLTGIGVFLAYGSMAPMAGLLFAVLLFAAWSFAQGRLPIAFATSPREKAAKMTVVRGATAYDEGYFEDVKAREIEREERERLRKLFEGK